MIEHLLSAVLALVVFNLTFTLNMVKKITKLCERTARIEATLKLLNDEAKELS